MKNIVIIGGHQGIGLGLTNLISKQADVNVIVTSRSYESQLTQADNLWRIRCDISCQDSINNFHNEIQKQFDQIDWLINCAGILHSDDYLPEKTLTQINSKQFLENYQTNAIGHLLLLKKMEKLVSAAENPIVASISARIGSIKDNQLGGWYSYRMSKAALNMGFKTLEIEWQRKYPHIKLLLLHPGTTDTHLSKPFQQRLKAGMLQTVEQTSSMLLEQIHRKLNNELTYLFVDYKGLHIEW
jgi:NAD(P)-dependent dehydrogenase (short-subunit alcohol dehydrogenase family)